MKKVYIRANSPTGLPNIFRAGRAWAAGSTTEIEVLDQDDDPPGIEFKDNDTKQTITRPHPTQIGRNSFKQIEKDQRFSILENPEAAKDMEALRKENEHLRSRVAELEAQVGGGEDGTAPGGEHEGHKAKRGR